MSNGLESHSEPIEELTPEKLAIHPAIVKKLDTLRANALHTLRTCQPIDAPVVARSQAVISVIDLILGSETQQSIAVTLLAQQKSEQHDRLTAQYKAAVPNARKTIR